MSKKILSKRKRPACGAFRREESSDMSVPLVEAVPKRSIHHPVADEDKANACGWSEYAAAATCPH